MTKSSYFLLGAGVVAFCWWGRIAVTLGATPPSGVPEGLSAVDWAEIRAVYEAKRQAALAGSDPIVQEAYLKASNTDTEDQFGYSVAVDGDTLVVGAYREDSSATGVNGNQDNNSASSSGAAYVFVMASTLTLWDMNCDGAVSVGDIAGFVLALTNPAQYAAAFPDCDISNGDINGNGAVTVADIGLFVQLLTGR